MGAHAKNKGANGEREVIGLLQPIIDSVFGLDLEADEVNGLGRFELGVPELRRNLEQVRSGGHDVEGIPWLAIEVKRQEQLGINNWWEQTIRQAGEKALPVLIFKQNRKKWRVMMYGSIEGLLKARVEISLEDFKEWFRLAMIEEKNRRDSHG